MADEAQKGIGGSGTLSELLDESWEKSVWTELPDNLLLHIFCFLKGSPLPKLASSVQR